MPYTYDDIAARLAKMGAPGDVERPLMIAALAVVLEHAEVALTHLSAAVVAARESVLLPAEWTRYRALCADGMPKMDALTVIDLERPGVRTAPPETLS